MTIATDRRGGRRRGGVVSADQFQMVERLTLKGVSRKKISARAGLSYATVKEITLGQRLPPLGPWTCPRCKRRYDFRIDSFSDDCPKCVVEACRIDDDDVTAEDLVPALLPEQAARRRAVDAARENGIILPRPVAAGPDPLASLL